MNCKNKIEIVDRVACFEQISDTAKRSSSLTSIPDGKLPRAEQVPKQVLKEYEDGLGLTKYFHTSAGRGASMKDSKCTRMCSSLTMRLQYL